ncbi:MAG: hypothetical protein RLT05_34135 [Bauldia litoralis]
MQLVRIAATAASLAAATLFAGAAESAVNWADDWRYRAAERLLRTGQPGRAAQLMRLVYRGTQPVSNQQIFTGFVLGRALLSLRRPAEALPLLEAYHQKFPNSALGRYNYALALFSAGRYRQAGRLFLLAAKSPFLAGKARFYAALCRLYLGDRRAGVRLLREAQSVTHPKDPVHGRAADILTELLVLSAEGTLGRLDRFAAPAAARLPAPPGSALNTFGVPRGDKRWGVTALIGIEYDSNAILLPDGTVTPAEIARKHDWRFVFALGGRYDVWREGRHRLLLFGTVAGATYTVLDEFNQASILGGFAYTYTAERYQLRAITTVSRTWVAGNPFNVAVSFEPGISYRQNRRLWIDADLLFQTADYTGQPATPGEKREGPITAFKVRQNMAFSELILPGHPAVLFVGAKIGRAALGVELANTFGGINLGVIQRLPWKTTLYLEYDGTFRSFDNPSNRSTPARVRGDGTHTVALRLERPLTDWALAYVGYRYYRNNSNVGAFRATSHLFSSGIRFGL